MQTSNIRKRGTTMSRLIAIEALNFMSIKQARIEFDESGILNLAGYNDSGKSAITRLLEIILYDAYQNEQVNYIHDGEEMFGAGVEFDDGVSINKYKYSNGKSVWEMMKDDQVIYTNRLANGVAAMSGVPEPIQKYINVVEDEYTGEKLNVRRNTDKLFLVGMSGGDVYKIINAVLHCDTLAETVKRLNEDRNKVQSELASKSTQLETLKTELKNLKVIEESTLDNLRNKHENLTLASQRLDSITSIGSQKDQIATLEPHPELQLVDTTRFYDIQNVILAKQGVDKYDQELPPELHVIDTDRLRQLNAIQDLRKQLDVNITPELVPVDLQRLNDMKQIGMLFNRYYQHSTTLANIDKELQETQHQLKHLSDEHGFKICANCGTVAV